MPNSMTSAPASASAMTNFRVASRGRIARGDIGDDAELAGFAESGEAAGDAGGVGDLRSHFVRCYFIVRCSFAIDRREIPSLREPTRSQERPRRKKRRLAPVGMTVVAMVAYVLKERATPSIFLNNPRYNILPERARTGNHLNKSDTRLLEHAIICVHVLVAAAGEVEDDEIVCRHFGCALN